MEEYSNILSLTILKIIGDGIYMKLLLIGAGGREHALVVKLAKSEKLRRFLCTW